MTGVPIRVSTTPICKDFTGLWRFCGLLNTNRGIRLSDFGFISMQELSARL